MKLFIAVLISASAWFLIKYAIAFIVGFALGFMFPDTSYSTFVIVAYAVDIIAIVPAIIIYRIIIR